MSESNYRALPEPAERTQFRERFEEYVDGEAYEFRPQIKAKLGVVIVSRHDADLTLNCLNSIAPQLELNDARVVVVHASDDAETAAEISSALLEKQDGNTPVPTALSERTSLIEIGHCDTDTIAQNIALEFLKTENYLFAHPTATFPIGAISALFDVLGRDKVAAVSPYLAGGPFAGSLVAHFGNWPINHRTEMLAGAGWKFPNAPERKEFASRASMHCLLVRASALSEVGGLDDALSEPFSGADLSQKLLDAGYKIGFAPSAHVDFDDTALEAALSEERFLQSRDKYYSERLGGTFMPMAAWRFGRLLSSIADLFGNSLPHTHHPSMDHAK
ncbi:MAG: hypothetical protein AAGA22_05530 [Pseudomonadota bacterium]